MFTCRQVCVYLRCNIAQVEGVVHGFLAPLVIGCSSKVTSVEATPLVVGVCRSVKHVNTDTGERQVTCLFDMFLPVCLTTPYLFASPVVFSELAVLPV